MTWIIDASVAAKWFFLEEDHAAALSILKRGEPLHAPKFVLIELANIAWLKLQKGEGTPLQAARVPRVALVAFDELHDDADWLPRAIEIAAELRHPVYDCLYLAGAEALKATVLTADRRFLRQAHGTNHENRVILFSDIPARP
jgi:predicted nucleic acid-binding protein